MGCVSSKKLKQDSDHANHVVTLISSTYGALNLDKDNHQKSKGRVTLKDLLMQAKKKSPLHEEAEIIDCRELMADLEEEEEESYGLISAIKSPNASMYLRGFGDIDAKSPIRFFGSPMKWKRSGGKENKRKVANGLGTHNSKETPMKTHSVSSTKRSLRDFLNPEIVPAFQEELTFEEEQIKRVVPLSPTWCFLETFEKKCPPRGGNSVVIYTTTIRGIRKTFTDCNVVRSIIESHCVHMIERDISMHSAFKEELRSLTGKNEVKVPLLFVKGRLIGGAEEIVKLEEEGKLGILLSKMPRVNGVCEGCAGIRFLVCVECNGSSKVLGVDGKRSLKCRECNENGLRLCPFCC